MGDNFCRKALMEAGGQMNKKPSPLTYQSVVFRYIVRIALNIAALNYLKVLACDSHNTYLTAKFWEKIWIVTWIDFGPDQGKFMLVVR